MGHMAVLALLLLGFLQLGAHAFHYGDYIQAARKSQFHGQRTHWNDLIGESCPRFGRDRLVVVTLPKPVTPEGTHLDEYKIQLSFDGDRHLTAWLKLVGKGAPSVPMLRVKLKRSGEDLLGATAKVMAAPVHIQHTEQDYVAEWRNETYWPKRLLVSYRWDTHTDVDLDRGFVVLLAMGLLALGVLAVNAAMGAGPKLAQFLQEVAADLDTDMAATAATAAAGSGAGGHPAPPAVSNMWKGGGKAE